MAELFTKRCQASGDDGYSWDTPGFDNASDFSRPGDAGPVLDAFFRFPNVTIGNGITIVTAKITMEAQVSNADTTVNWTFSMNDIDNAVAPTDRATHAAMDRTTATVDQNNVPAWTINVTYDSPDFTAAVQEVVNRPGWASGQAMMVFIDNNVSSNNVYRDVKTYDLTTTNCALLTIEYGFIPRTGGIF